MAADKKNLVPIVIILVVVIAGVGVFQFVSFSGKPAVVPKKEAVKNTANKTTNANEVSVPDSIAPLAYRDPFSPVETPVTDPVNNQQNTQNKPVNNPPPNNTVNVPTAGPIPGYTAPFTLPTPPDPTPKAFLVGVLEGDTPLALIADAQGNQRLVQVGDLVDDQFRVVEISRRGLIVTNGKQTYTLLIGGSPNGQTNV